MLEVPPQAAPTTDDPAGQDADTDTQATETRKACVTVPQTTRRPRKIMATTAPSVDADR